MADDKRLDDEARESLLATLLTQHPDAYVTGIERNGLFIPPPDALVLHGQRLIKGMTSALGLVVPEDRVTVIETWDRVHAIGAATCLVHLVADPTQTVLLHLLDVTDRYGMLLGFVTSFRGDPQPPGGDGDGDDATVRPKRAVMHKNQFAVVVKTDVAASLMLGWHADDLIGRRTLELLHPDDHSDAIMGWMEMIGAPGETRRLRLRHRHRDGRWIWLEITNHNLLDDPEHGYVLAEMVDISAEMSP